MQSTLFDVQISARKAPAYSRLSSNELALQFFAAGFFDPARAEQALGCLQLMDFEGKALAEAYIEAHRGQASEGSALKGKSAEAFLGLRHSAALGAAEKRESAVTRKARERVAGSTEPR